MTATTLLPHDEEAEMLVIGGLLVQNWHIRHVALRDLVRATSPEYPELCVGVVTHIEESEWTGHAWIGVTDATQRTRAFRVGPNSPDTVELVYRTPASGDAVAAGSPSRE